MIMSSGISKRSYLVACLLLATAAMACGKSSSHPSAQEPAPAAAEVAPLDKMCSQLAPAITDCALADPAAAGEKLTPEETERVAAEHTKTMFHACRKEVGTNEAKLASWQACLAAHHAGGSCGELETCLAKPSAKAEESHTEYFVQIKDASGIAVGSNVTAFGVLVGSVVSVTAGSTSLTRNPRHAEGRHAGYPAFESP